MTKVQTSIRWAQGTPLTPEIIEQGAKLILERHEEPTIEYHNPKCPKITSGGKLACRCGAAPTEHIFEDELKRMGKL